MQLNYRCRIFKHLNTTIPIIMVHGLFGNLNNLRTISTILSQEHYIIQIDLRNHGNSPHARSMTYIEMAQDILELMNRLCIKKFIVIGHSMGGKVAMMLCMLAPLRVKKLIVLDIAPVQYNMKQYDSIFNAIEYINVSGVTDKIIATRFMQQFIHNKLLIKFLLNSFHQGVWKFNFLSIKDNRYNIGDWCTYYTWWGPALFIKGDNSLYLHAKYVCDLYHQFPRTCIHNVPHAGHWVHYDNPIYVSNIIKKFILHVSL